ARGGCTRSRSGARDRVAGIRWRMEGATSYMTRKRLHLGISPCPNNTFAFHGLLSGAIVPAEFDVDIELCDVETLNLRFRDGDFDATKASFAAVLDVLDDAVVLPVGAAVGYGVGPVVLRG